MHTFYLIRFVIALSNNPVSETGIPPPRSPEKSVRLILVFKTGALACVTETLFPSELVRLFFSLGLGRPKPGKDRVCCKRTPRKDHYRVRFVIHGFTSKQRYSAVLSEIDQSLHLRKGPEMIKLGWLKQWWSEYSLRCVYDLINF